VSHSQTSCQVPVEREVHVYLETNVLRYFDDAMLELLRRRSVQHDSGRIHGLRLDLRPPHSTID
jgi:hypothetical protein